MQCKGSAVTKPSGPCDACSLDIGVAEFSLRMLRGAELRFGLFRAWQLLSGNLDGQVEEWLYRGGRCDILAKLVDRGVFPTNVDEYGAVGIIRRSTEFHSISLRLCLWTTPQHLKKCITSSKKGSVLRFTSLEETRQLAGGSFAPSRLMLLGQSEVACCPQLSHEWCPNESCCHGCMTRCSTCWSVLANTLRPVGAQLPYCCSPRLLPHHHARNSCIARRTAA